MQLVVRTPRGDADITVDPPDAEVTIGEIVESVTGRPAPRMLQVDGRPVPETTSLSVSRALIGSVIDAGPEDSEPVKAGLVELVQIAGPGSGYRTTLGPGTFVVGPGREPDASPLDLAAVESPRLRIRVADSGPSTVCLVDHRRDQTDAVGDAWLDGAALTTEPTTWTNVPLVVGSRVFELRPIDPTRTTGRRRLSAVHGAGSTAFNRPPRTVDTLEESPLVVPDGGATVRDARTFPLLAMLAPLPIAVGMALLLGSPRFLLFGLMSPMMAGASWLSDRRQRKRDLGTASTADSEATALFRKRAAAAFATERVRRLGADVDGADIVQQAATTSPLLWQRRPGDHDAFHLTVGLAALDWQPPLERSNDALETAEAILGDTGPLRPVPITVDLAVERGIGVVADDTWATAAVSGSVLHACVTHGPADIDVVVITSPQRSSRWEWTKWLPHARTRGAPLILSDEERIRVWSSAMTAGWERPARAVAPSHLTLVVVDDDDWWRDRTSPLRPLFADPTMPVRFIAIADDVEDLPAVCTTILTVADDGAASVERLLEARVIDGVAAFLIEPDIALDVARSLAPLDDADLPVAADNALPGVVPIADLLGLADVDSNAIVERWSPGRRPPRARMVAGVSERGPLTLDLDDDGPHGLVAGTTGAGKSELLRSLIIGLAVEMQPDEINFVLVDFKGGSAFDVCAELPHTVGMVTDLDEHLAGRVLRCLRAELHHRELVLRDAGATDLKEYQALDGVAPLPRLVLVVDEFASVVAELPEFLPSLVDIAQRGRSLGIHMILATQRPAGVVDNKIKANTNLRIALRVQDDGDSLDVIGSKDAANLPRSAPGRAYARFSAGELTLFQSAYSTGTSVDAAGPSFDVDPWVIGRGMSPLEAAMLRRSLAPAPESVSSDSTDTDLSRLVDAVVEASTRLGQNDQRRPAPPPLPVNIGFDDIAAASAGSAVPIGRADLPDEQRQVTVEWTPGDSRLVFGIAGSGTSSLLVTIALGAAARYSADDVHLIAIDADTNVLAPLAALPHCGTVIRSDEGERLARLGRRLSDEVARRSSLAAELGGPARVTEQEPTIVVLIDNVGALRQTLDDDRELDGVWSSIERSLRDGQSLGICAVLTAKQERAIPTSLATQFPDRLVMKLGDQYAYAGFGFRPRELPTFVPGRAIRPDDKVEIQLVEPPTSIAAHISQLGALAATRRPPLRVDPLPTSVFADDVVRASVGSTAELGLAVGLDRSTADPAIATMTFGESFFVTGPSRSGRSGVLATMAHGAKHADSAVTVFAVTPRGGPLSTCGAVDDAPAGPGDVADWVERIAGHTGRRLVLLDDADRIAGPSFEKLAGLGDDQTILVITGRADALRAMNHWSRPLQRFRHGVLLRPTMSDGELLRVSLGTRLPRFAPQNGFLVTDGDVNPLLAAEVEPLESDETPR